MSHIVKNTTNLNILDLIAPHSCRGCNALGSVLCERCKNNILSETKTKVKTAPKIYSVGYRNGTLARTNVIVNAKNDAGVTNDTSYIINEKELYGNQKVS